MILNLSKFLYLFERNEEYFLYAPLSNSFAKLDNGLYEYLLVARRNAVCVDDLDDETKEMLRKMKVIGVNDEMEINKFKFNLLSRRFNPHHLYLTINPTLACNFACPYCFESSHPAYFMSDEVEDAILSFIQKHVNVTHLHVTWFGGEPLLAFNRIVSLSKRMQCLGMEYSAGMITNGYLLTPDKVALFEELKISSIQITIDGSEQTHNSRRSLKNGNATYRTILKNIEEAQKCSPTTSINVRVNIDQTNSQEFFEVHSYFKTQKYPRVSVYPGFVTDVSGAGKNPCVYDSNAMAAFLKEVYYKRGSYSQFFYPANITRVCAVRNPNAIVIGPLGELYKCWNDVGDFSRSYGSIDGTITNEEVLYEYLIKADHVNDKECNECAFFPVCDGGCPYQRIQNEKLGRPQNTCSLFKEHVEDFLMLHYDHKRKVDVD